MLRSFPEQTETSPSCQVAEPASSTAAETTLTEQVPPVEQTAAAVRGHTLFGKADAHVFRVVFAVIFPFALFWVAFSILCAWLIATPKVAFQAVGAVTCLVAFAPPLHSRRHRKESEGRFAFPAHVRSVLCGAGLLLFAAGLLWFASTHSANHFPSDALIGGLALFSAAMQLLIAFVLWPRGSKNR